MNQVKQVTEYEGISNSLIHFIIYEIMWIEFLFLLFLIYEIMVIYRIPIPSVLGPAGECKWQPYLKGIGLVIFPYIYEITHSGIAFVLLWSAYS